MGPLDQDLHQLWWRVDTLPQQALRIISWPPPSRAPPEVLGFRNVGSASPPVAPWLKSHHRKPPSSKLGSRRLCWPGQLEAGAAQGCQEMHFNTNERLQQALRHNRVSSSVVISISSHGDLETLPQHASRDNQMASSIKSSDQQWWGFRILARATSLRNRVASSFKSSTSSAGDLETLAQQALQCNSWSSLYRQ
ncbi:hypothetical protein AAY473_037214 [Plecturocebus cupreus]